MTHPQKTVEEEAVRQTFVTERVAWIDRIPRSVAMALLLLIFLLVWQLIYELGLISPIILSTPLETIYDLFFVGKNILSGGYMLVALWVTTQEVLLGFAMATGLGFFLGLLVGETAFGERAVMPYLVAINAMPKVAFAPLFVSWLGFGIASGRVVPERFVHILEIFLEARGAVLEHQALFPAILRIELGVDGHGGRVVFAH